MRAIRRKASHDDLINEQTIRRTEDGSDVVGRTDIVQHDSHRVTTGGIHVFRLQAGYGEMWELLHVMRSG